MSDKYPEILDKVLRSYGMIPSYGMTLLFLWTDQEHFNMWNKDLPESQINGKIEDVRVVNVPSVLLPTKTVNNKNDVGVAGIAFSKEKDYSDTVLMYYIEIQY